jgi:hypothetical protein
MPLKLNVGISRKIGEPNFGSRGATVGLELEIDSGLIDQPRQLQQQVARLFRLARASVDRELDIGESARIQTMRRIATPAQIRAVYAIARDRQIDLAEELNKRFGVGRPQDLTVEQSSQLIGQTWQSSDCHKQNGCTEGIVQP